MSFHHVKPRFTKIKKNNNKNHLTRWCEATKMPPGLKLFNYFNLHKYKLSEQLQSRRQALIPSLARSQTET